MANTDMLIATGFSNVGGYCIGLLHACSPARCTRVSGLFATLYFRSSERMLPSLLGTKVPGNLHSWEWNRLANRPGMAGIVPELIHGVLCPGRGSFCPGNVKIDHRAWIYGCKQMPW